MVAQFVRGGLLVSILLTTILAPTPASGTGPGDNRPVRPTDTFTVAGYDPWTNTDADVTDRSAGNYLKFVYTAATAVDNATITIDVPRVWPTPLNDGGLAPRVTGGVTVGDASPSGDPSEMCAKGDWSVAATSTGQRVVVDDVTCAAGQHVQVRMGAIAAPRVGVHRFRATVSSSAGTRRFADPRILVVPTPTTRLQVTGLPAGIGAGQSVPVVVRAVDRAGRTATRFTGTIWLTVTGQDCPAMWAVPMTAADRGRISVTVSLPYPGKATITADDVAHRALPGTGGPVVVTAPPDWVSPACPFPASYH